MKSEIAALGGVTLSTNPAEEIWAEIKSNHILHCDGRGINPQTRADSVGRWHTRASLHYSAIFGS
jgi:hypothetical protein